MKTYKRKLRKERNVQHIAPIVARDIGEHLITINITSLTGLSRQPLSEAKGRSDCFAFISPHVVEKVFTSLTDAFPTETPSERGGLRLCFLGAAEVAKLSSDMVS